MTPGTRLWIWSATGAVGATGLLYALFAYCMAPEDPMDVVNHPWQPVTLSAHVIAAPLWMFAFGVVWHSHVLPKLRTGARPRRRTGLTLLLLALPMAASGYLLQTSVEESWRDLWIVTHVGTSLLWLVVLVAHCLSRRSAG